MSMIPCQGDAPFDHLAPAELDLIEAIYKQHGAKDQWQLRDWCHQHCSEWTPQQTGRDRISLDKLAMAIGKTNPQIKRLVEEAEELTYLSTAFGKE